MLLDSFRWIPENAKVVPYNSWSSIRTALKNIWGSSRDTKLTKWACDITSTIIETIDSINCIVTYACMIISFAYNSIRGKKWEDFIKVRFVCSCKWLFGWVVAIITYIIWWLCNWFCEKGDDANKSNDGNEYEFCCHFYFVMKWLS